MSSASDQNLRQRAWLQREPQIPPSPLDPSGAFATETAKTTTKTTTQTTTTTTKGAGSKHHTLREFTKFSGLVNSARPSKATTKVFANIPVPRRVSQKDGKHSTQNAPPLTVDQSVDTEEVGAPNSGSVQDAELARGILSESEVSQPEFALATQTQEFEAGDTKGRQFPEIATTRDTALPCATACRAITSRPEKAGSKSKRCLRILRNTTTSIHKSMIELERPCREQFAEGMVSAGTEELEPTEELEDQTDETDDTESIDTSNTMGETQVVVVSGEAEEQTPEESRWEVAGESTQTPLKPPSVRLGLDIKAESVTTEKAVFKTRTLRLVPSYPTQAFMEQLQLVERRSGHVDAETSVTVPKMMESIQEEKHSGEEGKAQSLEGIPNVEEPVQVPQDGSLVRRSQGLTLGVIQRKAGTGNVTTIHPKLSCSHSKACEDFEESDADRLALGRGSSSIEEHETLWHALGLSEREDWQRIRGDFLKGQELHITIDTKKQLSSLPSQKEWFSSHFEVFSTQQVPSKCILKKPTATTQVVSKI
ncbi:hypothetical protein JCM33374_g292 [Metschnikowia sp. JCM 33374]|nr:hypothetical protein JCM33374_g292 [Metschnikowia sp. JCM 33374]